mgnify:CR=1 FL=1
MAPAQGTGIGVRGEAATGGPVDTAIGVFGLLFNVFLMPQLDPKFTGALVQGHLLQPGPLPVSVAGDVTWTGDGVDVDRRGVVAGEVPAGDREELELSRHVACAQQ